MLAMAAPKRRTKTEWELYMAEAAMAELDGQLEILYHTYPEVCFEHDRLIREIKKYQEQYDAAKEKLARQRQRRQKA